MPIIFNNRDLNDLKTTLAARGAGGHKVLTEVITDIVEEASAMMVKTIETTPSGLVPGKIGRVYSGDMRDAVGNDPVVRAGDKVSGTFGWTKEQLDYFLYQENGAAPGRNTIPPMHALLGAFIWAREELKNRIDALMRSK